MSYEFLLKRADGTTRPVCGYRAATPGADVKRFGAGRIASEELPPRVDLRGAMTPVEQQGSTSSCTANAVAGACEYLLKRNYGEDAIDVSRLFVYYNARRLDEGYGDMSDDGCVIACAIEGLKEYGACSEDTWSFDEDLVNTEPDEYAYVEAEEFIIDETAVVPTSLEAWKNCLAQGYPIIFGLLLFDSFDKHRKPGLVPEPTRQEKSRESHAGHAMLCVGYSDKDRVFIVRNSWGNDWGDDGYCYIPYRYLMNDKFNNGDSWMIKRMEELEMDDSFWGEDESIIGDYESELGEMSDEDYEDMLDAMGDFPLECRLGLIFLAAAGADEEISDAEYDAISGYMDHALVGLGSEFSAKLVLKNSIEGLEDETLLEESIVLLGDYLSSEMLAVIIRDLEEITGSDEEISEDEDNFINDLVYAWQIEGEASQGEYEEDEYEEDEYEEDE
ncbi:MAG: peptidase C1 [bacterium]|nr:peptidase C1 [bacterium]